MLLTGLIKIIGVFDQCQHKTKNAGIVLRTMATPGNKPRKKFNWYKWILPFLLLNLLATYFITAERNPVKEITWHQFAQLLQARDVARINIVDKERVEVYLKPGSLLKPAYKDLVSRRTGRPQYVFSIGSPDIFEQRLEKAQFGWSEKEQIEVTYSNSRRNADWLSWLIPIGLLLVLYFFYGRVLPAGGAGANVIDFSRSKAQEYQKGALSQITFKEVAGYDEAKAEVMEIVEFLKNPGNFTRIGAKIPKGILLVGPPGTGKTLMAKAVAGEAAVPFFSLSGSEFIELFVGVGASRVRDLFNRAKEKAPSIIFIDEIDTIGRIRGKAVSVQVNDERESTLNQLLAEMDGFEPNTGVIVMAATNRADILDPALLRAGRFDRHVYLELPNRQEREAIFNVHLKPLSLDSSVDSGFLASQTPGFSGADIANVCNEAALIAARRKKSQVQPQDFSDAIDRIVAGLEKKTRIITPEEKKIIAFHEAGHAVVSWTLPGIDPLVKVSIIPRGKSLGGAWFLPEERQIVTRSKLNDQLCATLAGRASEDIVFGDISSGALDDLEKATKQAYNMVVRLGLDDKIGNLSFYDSTGTYDNAFQRPYSEALAQLIDQEVQLLIADAYQRAKDVLNAKRTELNALAKMLLEKEIVYKDDMEKLLGQRLTRQEKLIA